MSILFAPVVERWRSTVERYVPKQYVDKVLWTINYESGGDPNAIGDNGVAIGLLQIQNNHAFSDRPTTDKLLDPSFNIQYAVSSLGISSGNFSAWGDGTNGQAPYDASTGKGMFGALGNHPFPTDTGGGVVDTITGTAGDIVGGAGDIIGGAVDNIPGVSTFKDGLAVFGNLFGKVPDVLGGTYDALKWILTPSHWYRLFFLFAGGTMVLTGAFMYARGDSAISDAKSFAKMGAI